MIKAKDIAYVRFQAPDLDAMERFLLDFGMVRAERTETALYMRGSSSQHSIHITHLGDEAKFLGFAMEAASAEDLQALAQANATQVVERNEPGGGIACELQDPNGYTVECVHGLAALPALDEVRPDFDVNRVKGPARFNTPVRHRQGPSLVVRLGHIAINVIDYHATYDWYNQRFGLIKSDEVFIGDEPLPEAVFGGFTRCDCGSTPVDHHTIFFVGTGEPKFGHAAFEVENLDDLMIGSKTLHEQSYEQVWGVGRHVLGSQIFDYWRDPFGNVLEHWTDGDLYDDSVPAKLNTLDALADNQWGESTPPAML